ncbi:uncharacterized protein LOC120209239 [Hibiscus syriacus]|uniref:uncharacterized protein LOC120209239 n=1 Tax=Hibiscus syriacus TaxID=106335 RepID=UPI001924D107|nr:uncharacterized protein LOC120209239 [Hibiscus syriacus]
MSEGAYKEIRRKSAEGRKFPASGLLCLWNKNVYEVSRVYNQSRFQALLGKFKVSNVECVIINVYDPSVEEEKEEFFRQLLSYVHSVNLPVCIEGDFNAYLDQEEKIDCPEIASKSLSNHNPVLLVEDGKNWGPKHFRLFNYMLEENGFVDMVHNVMTDRVKDRGGRGIYSLLQGTKKRIKEWPIRNKQGISEAITGLESKINDLEVKAQGSGLSTYD